MKPNLVYGIAIEDFYRTFFQVEIMLKSLRMLGDFCGKVILFTNQPEHERLIEARRYCDFETIEIKNDFEDKREIFQLKYSAILDHVDVETYYKIMYLDADIVVANDIYNVFDEVVENALSCVYEVPHKWIKNPLLSDEENEAAENEFKGIINGGTIATYASDTKPLYEHILKMIKHINSEGIEDDQRVLNWLMAKKTFTFNHLSDNTVYFPKMNDDVMMEKEDLSKYQLIHCASRGNRTATKMVERAWSILNGS